MSAERQASAFLPGLITGEISRDPMTEDSSEGCEKRSSRLDPFDMTPFPIDHLPPDGTSLLDRIYSREHDTGRCPPVLDHRNDPPSATGTSLCTAAHSTSNRASAGQHVNTVAAIVSNFPDRSPVHQLQPPDPGGHRAHVWAEAPLPQPLLVAGSHHSEKQSIIFNVTDVGLSTLHSNLADAFQALNLRATYTDETTTRDEKSILVKFQRLHGDSVTFDSYSRSILKAVTGTSGESDRVHDTGSCGNLKSAEEETLVAESGTFSPSSGSESLGSSLLPKECGSSIGSFDANLFDDESDLDSPDMSVKGMSLQMDSNRLPQRTVRCSSPKDLTPQARAHLGTGIEERNHQDGELVSEYPPLEDSRSPKANIFVNGGVYVDQVTEMDVLCGRGGLTNHHEGNLRFRNIVNEWRSTYQCENLSHDKKTKVSHDVLDLVMKDGARFLKMDKIAGRYYVLSKREARRKTAQALREKKNSKWTSKEACS